MQIGDLVRRRNNGDLAIVIPIEWIEGAYGRNWHEKVNVLTMRGYKQYWFPVECEVISENR